MVLLVPNILEFLFTPGSYGNQNLVISRCFKTKTAGSDAGRNRTWSLDVSTEVFSLKSIRWYAFTTQPRQEKVVVQQLESKSIEAFLPMLTTASRRKDRRAVV